MSLDITAQGKFPIACITLAGAPIAIDISHETWCNSSMNASLEALEPLEAIYEGID